MGYQLTIEPLGETIEVAEGQTLLDACLRNGIYLPYQCNHGLCGTCKVAVLDGDVDHAASSPFALMDFEREEGRTLACCAKPLSDITIEADVEEDPDAEHHPVQDVTATVEAMADLTPDIKAVWLRVPGAGLPFQAGQYVNLHLPGLEEPRAFSIASAPADPTLLELQVRRVPGGVGTTYIHENLAVGDRLNLSGPLGRFHVHKSAPEPMLFLAGGSGLSSPKSMVLDLLAGGWTGPITLIHGVRRTCDVYDADLLRELARRHSNFTYIPATCQGTGDDGWDGERGFVHEVAERHFNSSFKGMKAYLCGPPVMVDACVKSLMKGRLFEKDIHMESFVTKADSATVTKSPLYKRI